MTRMAISPRLATRTLENMRRARLFHRELWRSVALLRVFEGMTLGRTARRLSGSQLAPRGARRPEGHHLGQGGGGGSERSRRPLLGGRRRAGYAGAAIIPPATVSLLDSSMRMNAPVTRLRA